MPSRLRRRGKGACTHEPSASAVARKSERELALRRARLEVGCIPGRAHREQHPLQQTVGGCQRQRKKGITASLLPCLPRLRHRRSQPRCRLEGAISKKMTPVGGLRGLIDLNLINIPRKHCRERHTQHWTGLLVQNDSWKSMSCTPSNDHRFSSSWQDSQRSLMI